MATLPPDGSKEALAKALSEIPSDRAMELTPDIQARFSTFAGLVYPHVPKDSKQYGEMEMVWHAAYLDMLDVLSTTVTTQEEDMGVEMIHCLMTQCTRFLESYNERVHGKKPQQHKEEKK
jgi:hypothetical protein